MQTVFSTNCGTVFVFVRVGEDGKDSSSYYDGKPSVRFSVVDFANITLNTLRY